MKKLISVLLSGALTLSLCTGTAFASSVPAPLEGHCSQEEWEILKLTNKERLAKGLSSYSTFAALQDAADIRDHELPTLYSHTRPDGSTFYTVLEQTKLDFNSAGENIAAGQTTPKEVVDAWMNSTGHRANILDADFAHMGTGLLAKDFTISTADGSHMYHNGWEELFLTHHGTVENIALSTTSASCLKGTNLDDLNLYVQAECSYYGATYLPLLSEMCTGFDPYTTGRQTVTVTHGGKTATLDMLVYAEPLDTTGADGWAKNWLEQANALGLLSHRNRSAFTTNLTRLQFADLAVTMAEALTGNTILPVEDGSFSDTNEVVIRKAKAAGIAGGYQVGDSFEFRPGNPITRQEICVMLSNAMSYVNRSRDTATLIDRAETINGTFTDTNKVAGWAVKPVALMTNNGVMGGKAASNGVALAPESNTTLQEAIILTVKLFNLF